MIRTVYGTNGLHMIRIVRGTNGTKSPDTMMNRLCKTLNSRWW